MVKTAPPSTVFPAITPSPGASARAAGAEILCAARAGLLPPGESLEFREYAAQRITVELPRYVNSRGIDASLFDFEGPSNIQTFMIWRQPEASGIQ